MLHEGLSARLAPRTVAGQLVRFALVGLLATAMQYACLVALVHLLSMPAPRASTIGFLISAVANYALNYQFTFRSAEDHSHALVKFAMVAAVGLLLNYGVMQAGVGLFSIHYLVAQVAATALVLAWSFTANRVWTFRQKSVAR